MSNSRCRFAWTSYSSVPWIVPIIASSLFGAGQYIVVLGILNYVVDSYQTYSASALAGVILVRNTVGAGFPLFGKQMYTTLGYEWAGSLLGFLSLLFIPIVSQEVQVQEYGLETLTYNIRCGGGSTKGTPCG